ncbi:MAG: hypothetical protein SCM96_00415 [Acidobacteriota bacterium]|nr:hypothetical protein [Acidobacteriota bacterium]
MKPAFDPFRRKVNHQGRQGKKRCGVRERRRRGQNEKCGPRLCLARMKSAKKRKGHQNPKQEENGIGPTVLRIKNEERRKCGESRREKARLPGEKLAPKKIDCNDGQNSCENRGEAGHEFKIAQRKEKVIENGKQQRACLVMPYKGKGLKTDSDLIQRLIAEKHDCVDVRQTDRCTDAQDNTKRYHLPKRTSLARSIRQLTHRGRS